MMLKGSSMHVNVLLDAHKSASRWMLKCSSMHAKVLFSKVEVNFKQLVVVNLKMR